MQQQPPDSSPGDRVPGVTNADSSGGNTERLRYIEYAGKRILLVDISACNPEQLIKCIDAIPQHVTKQPEHSVLLLADLTATEFTREVIEHMKIAAVFDRPHIAKAAWVVGDNLSKVLMDSIRTFSARDIAAFPTREQGLDYLVS